MTIVIKNINIDKNDLNITYDSSGPGPEPGPGPGPEPKADNNAYYYDIVCIS